MKKSILISLLIVVVAVVLYQPITRFVVNHFGQTKKIYSNVDPQFAAGSNTVSIGIYTKDGQLINNGGTLTPANQKLDVVFSLAHNIDIERNYGLIVLKNFQQTAYDVSGKPYTMYQFDMKANGTINIPVDINVGSNDQEIDFLVIKKPEYFLKDRDFNKATALQEVMPLRFLIDHTGSNSKQTPLPYQQPDQSFDKGPNDYVFLSQRPDELNALFQNQSDTDAYLSVGNIEKEKQESYAVVSFLGWKQVPFPGNQMVKYVSVPNGNRQVFHIHLPKTNEEQNYQIVALPHPYQVSPSDSTSQMAFGSFRTILEP